MKALILSSAIVILCVTLVEAQIGWGGPPRGLGEGPPPRRGEGRPPRGRGPPRTPGPRPTPSSGWYIGQNGVNCDPNGLFEQKPLEDACRGVRS